MSSILRVVLIVSAFCLLVFVVLNVRKSKLRIEDAVFWVLISALILLLSIFPRIASWASGLLGFQASINLVYLFFIFILLVKSFTMSRQLSEQETKLTELTQHVALDKLDHYERVGARSVGDARGVRNASNASNSRSARNADDKEIIQSHNEPRERRVDS